MHGRGSGKKVAKKSFRISRQDKNKLENIKKLLVSGGKEDVLVGLELLDKLPKKLFLHFMKSFKDHDNDCTYEIEGSIKRFYGEGSEHDMYILRIQGNYLVSMSEMSIYIDHPMRVKKRIYYGHASISDELLEYIDTKWKKEKS